MLVVVQGLVVGTGKSQDGLVVGRVTYRTGVSGTTAVPSVFGVNSILVEVKVPPTTSLCRCQDMEQSG